MFHARPARTVLVLAALPTLASAGDQDRVDAQIRARSSLLASMIAGADDCAACRAGAGLYFGAHAGPGRVPFDAQTGRSLLNYPPTPSADFRNLSLSITVPDMNRPAFDATETLTFAPTGFELSELSLNARLLTVRHVTIDAHTVAFTHDGQKLAVSVSPPIPPGQEVRVVIDYSVNNPPAGLIWTPESPEWPGRPAQFHTQGQPETNSYWFPCHDFPNDRLTTDITVDVPQGYLAVSNGRLIDRQRSVRIDAARGGAGAREVFHWSQDADAGGDHPSYLVSLIVGKFDVVDVGSGSLPMPVYVPPGRGPDARATYSRTPDMARFFGRRFEEPYPWSKYAQTLVWNFSAGGMENTSATTMYDTAVLDPQARADRDLDGLISHELAHQWFGDLITCKSWEHVWLNEGWATYCSALWFESERAPEGGRDVYDAVLLGNFDAIIANDKPQAPGTPAMVSKAYAHPWETFRRGANPYSKGAAILHMLRRRLGDDAFFRGVAAYIDAYKHRNAETNDFRRALEAASGESLEQFFQQWCYRPGVPTLDVKTEWAGDRRELRLNITQTQNVDASNPAFAFSLPVWIDVSTGKSESEWQRRSIDVSTRVTRATIPLDLGAMPRCVLLDPELHVLAGIKADLPEAMLVRAVRSGPTGASRARSARALGEMPGPAAGGALADLARNAEEIPALRVEAVHALQAGGRFEEIDRLWSESPKAPAVRTAMMEALADLGSRAGGDSGTSRRTIAVNRLAKVAREEPLLRTRAAAIMGLGKLRATDQIELIRQAGREDSQDDDLRQAALSAYGDLGGADSLTRVIEMTRPGVLGRTRARAAEIVSKLGAADANLAFTTLSALTSDREERARQAAIRGLADLTDARAEALLTDIAAKSPSDADRATAQASLDTLHEKLHERPRAEVR